MNKKGFTLIEMLVVIAIIAVLVAIVIPTVSSATVKASAATNAANLRSYKAQLTTAYLSNPESITIASGTVTEPAATFTYKKVGNGLDPSSETVVAKFNDTSKEFTVYFGDESHNINYYATIAESGKS